MTEEKESTGKAVVHTPGDKADPTLVRQPHGGALMSGGTPGNVGGGRPPAEIRDHARRVFDTAMSFLEKMASGEATRTVFETFECTGCGKKNDLELKHYPQDKDVLKAIEMAGKYGIRADGYDKQFVERLFMVVHHHVQDLVGGIDALTAIEEVWNRILAEYEQT